MNENEEWLIPFRGREYSGTFECNFLWKCENVYVMDNHRLALWCWLRHLDVSESVDLMHIDQHYDCLMSQHKKWVEALPPNISKLSLEQYQKFSYMGDEGSLFRLFRFDSYLSLFMARYGSQIDTAFLSTHSDGDKPEFDVIEFSMPESMGYLNARCSALSKVKTILNIDIASVFGKELSC